MTDYQKAINARREAGARVDDAQRELSAALSAYRVAIIGVDAADVCPCSLEPVHGAAK